MIVLGVDPGGTTGLVLRRGPDLLWHRTVAGGWDTVLTVLHDELTDCRFDVCAVEAVVAPGGFAHGKRAPINLSGLITTAQVAGAVAAWCWTDQFPVVWVPPAHNGQGALEAYPEQLRPTRGQGRGADNLRHERSAFDVAGLGALLIGKGVRSA